MATITNDLEGEILELLAEYMANQETSLIQEMIYKLTSNEDREAAVAAARLTELKEIKAVITDAFKERRERTGDEPNTEPTRYT